jgi:hypothetical protein
MRYFIIRHKPTGFALPFVGRGATHMEPQDPTVWPPRLFAKEGAAKTALTWWLKGRTSVTYTCGDGWEVEADEHWHTEPVEDRRAEGMEVVLVHLIR